MSNSVTTIRTIALTQLESSKTVSKLPIDTFSGVCTICSLHPYCFHEEDNKQAPKLALLPTKSSQIFHKGQHLCNQGSPLKYVYVVRSGNLKSYSLSEEGEMQITGFHYPGEVIGLDALYKDEYQNSTIALNTASVCKVPLFDLIAASQKAPDLLHSLLQLMSKEISEDKQMFLTLSQRSVESRLAAFLVNHSKRLKGLNLSHQSFQLPMTRSDIGNFLGMAVETVSRELTRMQQQGLISVAKREITINQPHQLNILAGLAKPERQQKRCAS